MNRRNALATLLAALAAAGTAPVDAAPLPKIGYLTLAPLGEKASGERLAFLEELRELGYVDGRSAQIVYRSGEMNIDLLEFAAQALVEAKVDVIAAAGTVAALAAKRVTRTIPIVMVFASEPVIAGLVANLGNPGGNVTGVSTIQTELDPKRLAMLKEVDPSIARVAVLWTRVHPSHAAELNAIEGTALSLGIALESFDVTEDLLGALRKMDARLPDALFVMWDFRTLAFRQFIVDFALKHQLPTSMPTEDFVEAGGLMSYGPNVETIFRRSASYVHRILLGAKPANLPVERPIKFDLVVNLTTAKAVGVELPPTLVLLADRVVR